MDSHVHPWQFMGSYLLANNDYELNNKLFSVLSVVCILLLVSRYYLVYRLDKKSEPLFSYFGLYNILPSIWVFLFIKRISKPLQLERFSNTWRFLASKSYGVYLLHAFFIVVLEQFIPMNSLLFMTIGVIIIYLSAMMTTYLLQQSIYTDYLLPWILRKCTKNKDYSILECNQYTQIISRYGSISMFSPLYCYWMETLMSVDCKLIGQVIWNFISRRVLLLKKS